MNPRNIRKNVQGLVRAGDALGLPSSACAASVRAAYNVLRACCSDDAELVASLGAAKAAALVSPGSVSVPMRHQPCASFTQYWFWQVLTSPAGTAMTWPVPRPLHAHVGTGDGARHNGAWAQVAWMADAAGVAVPCFSLHGNLFYDGATIRVPQATLDAMGAFQGPCGAWHVPFFHPSKPRDITEQWNKILRWFYVSLQLELNQPRLLVIGPNGIGKSNLLEAVELLGSLRSHRCSSDRDLIQWDASKGLLRAEVGDGDQLELELRRSGGRLARRNGKVLDRQLDLIGPLRCIGFSALDLDLVRGEPALRRQWLDRVVLQLEPVYAELISRYGRLLRQRSQLWRQRSGRDRTGLEALLDAFDIQMALVSTRIHRRRLRALRRLEPIACRWQSHLSAGSEQLHLSYQPGSRLDEEEAEEPFGADETPFVERPRLGHPDQDDSRKQCDDPGRDAGDGEPRRTARREPSFHDRDTGETGEQQHGYECAEDGTGLRADKHPDDADEGRCDERADCDPDRRPGIGRPRSEGLVGGFGSWRRRRNVRRWGVRRRRGHESSRGSMSLSFSHANLRSKPPIRLSCGRAG